MDRIYSPKIAKKISELYDITMKKSLGQNFLVDGNVVRHIVDSAKIDENSNVLEVGPGIGALTEEVLIRGAKLSSIEIDQRFVEILHDRLDEFHNFQLIHGDAVDEEVFESAAQGKDIFISNMPYVVTTPLLERIFLSKANFKRAVIMVQKEVAIRMVASPNSKDYGSLSVFVKAFADAKRLFTVKPMSFMPKPKVDSEVLLLEIKKFDGDIKEFMKIVHASFSARRKTLLNSLSIGLKMEKSSVERFLLESGIDPAKRAENLNIDDFYQMYKIFNNKGV